MVQTVGDFLRAMPKVELHVHLEGAIPPETVLRLARKSGVRLPADTVEGIRDWYRFTDFDHFVDIYLTVSACLKSVEDVELIAREFLAGQAAQNIRHTEFTYSAWNHYMRAGWAFADQLAALNRARDWAEREFGITSGIVIDIVRIGSADDGIKQADWAISGMGNGVVALGLGGPEVGNPAARYAKAFARAHAAGLPCVPHAGETVGPDSIWDALDTCRAVRIGHGVRCLSDAKLVATLRERRIALEVCPTSNVCVGGVARIEDHPLPKLLKEGLFVTLNSDDPPMFDTTLTDEYLTCARVFGFGPQDFERLVQNAAQASLLPADRKAKLAGEISSACARLRLGVR
jgi:adenosine deaminase